MTNFQFLVKESNKSLTEISRETGISYSTLGNYNQGTRTPKKKNAKILADYFGVSIPYLLGLDDNRQTLDCIGEKLMKYDELSIGQKLLVEAKVINKNDLSTDEGVVRLRVLGVGFVDILKTEIEQTIIYPLNEESKKHDATC